MPLPGTCMQRYPPPVACDLWARIESIGTKLIQREWLFQGRHRILGSKSGLGAQEAQLLTDLVIGAQLQYMA